MQKILMYSSEFESKCEILENNSMKTIVIFGNWCSWSYTTLHLLEKVIRLFAVGEKNR